jgi:hypothetical protein
MNDDVRRRLEMLIRVDGFGRAFASSFPATSRGGQLFATVRTAIGEVEGKATVQSSSARTSQQHTASKAVARAALIEEMQAINLTAKAIALGEPGVDDKFRLPRGASDQVLLATARAFAQDAAPLSEEFIKREMPATFLDELSAAINEFSQTISERNQSTASQVSATAAIDEAMEKGLNAAQELNAVVKNRLRDDRAALAEWTSARHVERRSRKAKSEPQGPEPDKPAEGDGK